jgi:hypothetical protein
MRCDLHYLAIARKNLLSPAFALRPDIEVKRDGFRLTVLRDGDRVRLFIGNGFDWTSRYPALPVKRSPCFRGCVTPS